jgi:hypothetical protein
MPEHSIVLRFNFHFGDGYEVKPSDVAADASTLAACSEFTPFLEPESLGENERILAYQVLYDGVSHTEHLDEAMEDDGDDEWNRCPKPIIRFILNAEVDEAAFAEAVGGSILSVCANGYEYDWMAEQGRTNPVDADTLDALLDELGVEDFDALPRTPWETA